MRAVAIILVVLAHAEVPFFEGGFIGVDVFFLLSGFLITGLLLREVEKSGTLSFVKFYARRARRLLPLAALCLLFIAAGSSLILPPLQQADAITITLGIDEREFEHGRSPPRGSRSPGRRGAKRRPCPSFVQACAANLQHVPRPCGLVTTAEAASQLCPREPAQPRTAPLQEFGWWAGS